jgi:hypothetical protein
VYLKGRNRRKGKWHIFIIITIIITIIIIIYHLILLE